MASNEVYPKQIMENSQIEQQAMINDFKIKNRHTNKPQNLVMPDAQMGQLLQIHGVNQSNMQLEASGRPKMVPNSVMNRQKSK